MIEVSGILITALFAWVITALFTYASIDTEYVGVSQVWGALALILGTASFILTLVGTEIIKVI